MVEKQLKFGIFTEMPAENMKSVLTIIPSRYDSTRLPGKPLIEINGKPMILHVLEQAIAADIGPVLVATDNNEILSVVVESGGDAVLTRKEHESGSDRIYEALQQVDPHGEHEIILNLQGDVPLIDPESIRSCIEPLENSAVDVGTIATLIDSDEKLHDPNFVKVVGTPIGEGLLRALYFTREPAPGGVGPHYLHIGVYSYRRQALEQFVSMEPSCLEKREKLEQLRALENGMRIDVKLIDGMPFDVNTSKDVEELISHLEKKNSN